ncbi:MAG: hypothetical protein WD059_06540 [Balneolaceae bacterium]
MFDQYQERFQYRLRERQVVNVLLTLATGILTLIFPNFLYLIAGVYLVALGVLFIVVKIPATLSAIPILTGLLIFIFPELIPITFAAFLIFFGLIMLLIFGLTVMGIITLIIAALIIMNPDYVAYLIAFFLLLYAITNLIQFYRDWQDRNNTQDDGPVSIQ